MPYKITIEPAAVRALAKLQVTEIAKIKKKIDSLAEDCRPHGVEKLSGHDNAYRIRVGDYRIVYGIYDKQLVIVVVMIKHRKEVYRDY
jgi:mRNA interferase RelE/StbE